MARVLVVDPDPTTVFAIKRVLQRDLNCQVVDTDCGLDAVVTDVVMPRMTGPKFVAAARESVPAMKVMYMSGYADRHLNLEAEDDRGVRFLQKPFERERLLYALADLLHGR